jgi:hypothetical protein
VSILFDTIFETGSAKSAIPNGQSHFLKRRRKALFKTKKQKKKKKKEKRALF